MYSYRYSKEFGLLVGIYSGTEVAEEDIEKAVQAAKTLDFDGQNRSKGLVYIKIISENTRRHNSTIRRKVALWRQTLRSRIYFSLVAFSHEARGLLTALSWVAPPPENFLSSVHESFAEAVAWSEKKRGEKLPVLYRLFDEAKENGSPKKRIQSKNILPSDSL